MNNLFDQAKEVIQAGISELGFDLNDCKSDVPYDWKLKRGSLQKLLF